jgi:hypothetical protein
MATDKLKQLVKDVAFEILDHPRFREVLREVVLRVVVTEDQQRRLGAVRAFLGACDARGMLVSTKEGKIYFTHPERLGPDLKAVLILHREDILGHLEAQQRLQEAADREAAKRLQQREEKRDGNGVAARPGTGKTP